MQVFAVICLVLTTAFAMGQQPTTSAAATDKSKSAAVAGPAAKDEPAKTDAKTTAADSALKGIFEAKIKTEWEALKNKDKKAYGDLLADEYQGVETDGQGERNKLQAINELVVTNVFNYTLWGLKVTPLGPDSVFEDLCRRAVGETGRPMEGTALSGEPRKMTATHEQSQSSVLM
jgi:hypothetical protein